VLREDGRLIATTQFEAPPDLSRVDAATKSRNYIRRHWAYREPAQEPGDLLERAKSHALCISGMAFQDAWNIDLQRLKRCCVHVVTPERKLIPFCAYYLTGSTGQKLVGSRQSAVGSG
jgi:7,8-dihydro-6-hydroxymethylpterin dimethyltransferase